jgi:hypothetical protein
MIHAEELAPLCRSFKKRLLISEKLRGETLSQSFRLTSI